MPKPNSNGKSDGITRRDFLDGAAISAAGLAVAAAAPKLTGAEAAQVARSGRPQLPRHYYPPGFTDPLNGEPDPVIDATMEIDGRPISSPADIHSSAGGPGISARIHDTHEVYDCVIVGAGASGLAAAKFYRDRFGPDSKILLIDPLPDFGGHSHRNEFHIPNQAAGGEDVMILRNGGTVNLDSIGTWNQPTGNLMDIPGEYGQSALDLLEFCGVDYGDDADWEEGGAEGIPDSFGLRSMLLFPAADYGADACIPARDEGGFVEPDTPQGWTDFLARTPYSQASRDSIVACQTTEQDWLANAPGAPLSPEQKVAYLASITYKHYLTEHVGVTEEAFLGDYWRGSGGLLGTGGQAVSAADCWMLGRPGFPAALGLPDTEDLVFPGIGRTPQMDAKSTAFPSRRWPDGNTSLLRLLLSKLIPRAFPDVDGERPNQVNIVKAKCDYSYLDRRDSNVRLRLNSLVTKVRPGAHDGDLAEVDYVPVPLDRPLDRHGRGGHGRDASANHGRGHKPKGERVRATHVIMACWNRVTSHLVEGLPPEQVENLCYARKVPLIYGRAGLNNWQAFADAKIDSISPRGKSLFWDSTRLSAGDGFGPASDPAYGPTPNQPPTAPATLTFQVVPNDPDAVPQLYAYETGRRMLLEASFRDLEDSVVDVLDRSLNQNGGDFDPERDIDSWVINRWNYGYAHELSGLFDPSLLGPWSEQPQRKGAMPFKNVSIGNSDSQAFAYTHSAIQEGYRAVQDLPSVPSRRFRSRRRARSAA
ncbi:MAG: NAD(P)-binding protein [Solirubrobacterales bacterium]|nr:NAD(P)-binding protein [Solirubrobacterales bacterium]